MQGWLIPEHSVVALDGPRGVVLLDGDGQRLGTFEGRAGDELRACLAGAAPPGPLVSALARHAPGLAALLATPAQPLTPATLLRRRAWGQLFVELTARCNERCQHCYASAGPEREEALDRPTAEAVVREAAALGFQVVQLTGGEALLCPFLDDLVRLGRSLGIPCVEVYTNGVLLSARRYEPLRAAGASFAFSLYAADPASHDEVTRLPGSHALTVAAIGRAVAGGSEVRVGVIVTRPGGEKHAAAAVALCASLGVPQDHVRVESSHAVGRGALVVAPDDATRREGAPHTGGAGGGHAIARGGKAAVMPDGRVTPCIFARERVLGRVGPNGGLRAALERPAVDDDEDHGPGPAAEEVAARLFASGARLTCAECRLVDALLAPLPARALPVAGPTP